jgi:hypothetical protein
MIHFSHRKPSSGVDSHFACGPSGSETRIQKLTKTYRSTGDSLNLNLKKTPMNAETFSAAGRVARFGKMPSPEFAACLGASLALPEAAALMDNAL